MQQLRLIKGKSYLIDGIPHLYQTRDNGVYKFLKIDGTQKYLYDNDLSSVKLTPQDVAYEQKLKDTEDEVSYYKEKYNWYQEKEKRELSQKNYVTAKRTSWFADSRFVQISTVLTIVAVAIFAFVISIDSGKKSDNFGVGLLTFAGILLGGIIVSLLIAWFAYKAEEFIDAEKKSNLLVKLIFFLPPVWFALFKILQLLLLSSANAE